MGTDDGKIQLRGALTALVTPFSQDGSVDLEGLERIVRWQVVSGIHGLVPCGTTGEGATLTDEEHHEVIATVVRTAEAGLLSSHRVTASKDTRQTDAPLRSYSIEIEQLSENLPTVADWLPDVLLPFWEVVAQFPIVGGLIVAGVSYLFAVTLRFAVFRSLGRLADMTNSLLDDELLRHLRKPLFTTVLYFGLTLAVNAAQLREDVTGMMLDFLGDPELFQHGDLGRLRDLPAAAQRKESRL